MTSVLFDILNEGVSLGASDWHIKEGKDIYLRVDSELMPTTHFASSELIKEFINEVATHEQVKDYDKIGDLDLGINIENVGRFRINLHRQRGLHSISLRHIKSEILNFEQLNLPPIVKEIASCNRGIIFITGTTGSGKSTTLASMLQYININMCKHIITVEDPVEYNFEDELGFFEQREIGLDTISFESALKHALRQDPDIIMIGEMRDAQTFETALQAADTGHLVFTTLHASDAAQTITRILDFYHNPDEQANIRKALALNLKAIISQRLAPSLQGGVVPVTEIMINTATVRKLIERNMTDKLPAAIETGREDGMHSFNQILLEFLDEGKISVEEALKVAGNPEALKMNIKGVFLSADNGIIG